MSLPDAERPAKKREKSVTFRLRTGEQTVSPPTMRDLSVERPVLRRQLYRAYRGWLDQLVKEQGDRMPGRSKMVRQFQRWDLRFSDEQTPELATLLLEEVPIAMMAALGRTCRDRGININVRMVLARDYRYYRASAREMVDSWRRTDKKMREIELEKLMTKARKERETAERAEAEVLAQAEEREKMERRTWWQKLRRAWWLFRGWLGLEFPTARLEELAELSRAGREDEMMERFYELGGTVTKVKEPNPPWTELGDTWNEVDGEIWNVEPCYTGGRMIYVGNIFKDPVIRGKENPYFNPKLGRQTAVQ